MSHPGLNLVESAPLPYLPSLPGTAPPLARVWPILCFLDGYGEGPPMQIRQALTQHGPLRPTSSSKSTTEFIIVALQLPTRGDLWYRYADAVQAIVQQVQALNHGASEQSFLTGFSFGGNGVFDLALERHDFWAALWAVDPTRMPVEDPRRPVWLSFGEISRHKKASFIRHLHLKPLQSRASGERVYVDQG